MPKHISKLIFCLLFFCSISSAQSNPRLLVLKKDQQTVYLFGTIHVGESSFYPLPEPVMSAFSEADIRFFEMDITSLDVLARIRKITYQHGFLDQDEKLTDFISKESWTQLQLLFSEKELAGLINARPWLMMLMLAEQLSKQVGLDANQGVDRYLLHYAQSHDLAIKELEKPDDQLSIFYQTDDLEMAQLIDRGLGDMQGGQADLKSTVIMWETGDVARAEALLKRSKQDFKGTNLFDQIIKARNKKFVDKISKSNEYQTIFLVIGSLHLYGANSIQHYFQEKGYKILE